ncbi:hypothetical protein QR680_002485 [Steinernema hermaphroditum]|uniref:Uncharacterized protein n=1 Tax=Steinernema hermaphroditum TaxID=289476 RepID=A0AA39H518_9BILA|nr:hypothetical protein QR680_002485 [Steinernema hermaphroditum]
MSAVSMSLKSDSKLSRKPCVQSESDAEEYGCEGDVNLDDLDVEVDVFGEGGEEVDFPESELGNSDEDPDHWDVCDEAA